MPRLLEIKSLRESGTRNRCNKIHRLIWGSVPLSSPSMPTMPTGQGAIFTAVSLAQETMMGAGVRTRISRTPFVVDYAA